MLGIVPPDLGGLDINWSWLNLLDELFGSVGQGSWWVGGSNQIELPVSLGVLQDSEGIFERSVTISNTIVDITIDIGLSQEAMDNSEIIAH